MDLSPEHQQLLDMFNNDEPLHPDLVDWVEEKEIGTVLRHPLVYEVPHLHTSTANRAYLAKQKILQRALDEEDWQTVIWIHERPHRLWALGQIEYRLDDDDYWPLLRDVWVDSENIWQNLEEWQDRLNEDRWGSHLMMDDEERAVYDALPEQVTVYRGAINGLNERSLSWTLDKERAEWFANRFDRDGGPIVLTGVVAKDEIRAYIASRGEQEILVATDYAVVVNP